MKIRAWCFPILSWPRIRFSKRLCYHFSISSINAVKKSVWVIWLTNRGFWVRNIVFWIVERVFELIWLMFRCSPGSPCSPNFLQIVQFVEPYWNCPLWFSVSFFNPGFIQIHIQIHYTRITLRYLGDSSETTLMQLGYNFWTTLGQLLVLTSPVLDCEC